MNIQPKIRGIGYTDNWNTWKVGEKTKSFSGGTPKSSDKSFYGGYIPFIRSGEINSDITELFITEEALNNSSAKMVAKGDILYALYGATSGEVSLSKIKGAINQAILAIKPNNGNSSEFIMNYLKKKKDTILRKYLQGGQGNLSASIIKNIEIGFPSQEEQHAIGTLFRTLDDLLASYKDNLANYQSLKSTMLFKMFPKAGQTVPEIRLDGFEGEWKFIKLGEAILEAYQGINTASDKVEYSISGIPILQAKHITNGQINYRDTRYLDMDIYEHYISKYMPKKGEILFANIGTIGPSVLVDSDEMFLIAWNILKMSIKENYSPVFIKITLSLLDSKHIFERITTGNATKFINKDEIMDIRISVPSLEEQQAIGIYFSNLDNLIAAHQEKISQLETLKKKLLQDMFM